MLEAAGEADRFMFGFEESYGYLAGTHVRDKDAVVASMLICQMARYYRCARYVPRRTPCGLLRALRVLLQSHSVSDVSGRRRRGARWPTSWRSLRRRLLRRLPVCAVERVIDYAQERRCLWWAGGNLADFAMRRMLSSSSCRAGASLSYAQRHRAEDQSLPVCEGGLRRALPRCSTIWRLPRESFWHNGCDRADALRVGGRFADERR